LRGNPKAPGDDPVRAKIGRAEVHMRNLKHLVAEFDWSQPYKLDVIVQWPSQEGPGHRRQHAIVVSRAAPIPLEIRLVAGDFLTNLRASLDHLAWELALADPPGEPNDHTGFPIKEKRPKSGLTIAGGVSAAALKLVEKMQPYNRPEGVDPPEDRLWILNKLVNIDKHRRLLLTTTAFETIRVRIAGKSWENRPMEPISIEPGAYLIGVAGARRKGDIECKLTTTVSLRKKEPGGVPALDTLFERLLVRVRDEVVPAFDGMR
jgi:hypothetical protein